MLNSKSTKRTSIYNFNNKNGIKKFQTINLTKKNIKKILIIKWGGMGDIILSTGIMHDVRVSFPKSEIHLNTLPQWKDLFKNDQRFDHIWGSNKSQKIGFFNHLYNWLKKIRSEKYDLIIDLQTNDRTRIYLTILKVLKICPKYLVGNHGIFPYSIFPKENQNLQQPFQLLQRTINTIGIESKTIYPKLFLTKEENELALKLLKKNNLNYKEYVAFICGSHRNGKLKRWGSKNFIRLSKLIMSDFNLKIILIGGPDDINECINISKQNKKIINLCNKTKLKVLPRIFQNAKFIIGNDTGTSHLVSMTNTPMIEMFGPTDPIKSKPLGKNIIAVKAENSLMENISPNHILKMIKEIL
tara:strand:- start:2050 stop:3117 length:1068 start_codon:yes stop_codon:yes gene_type:complete